MLVTSPSLFPFSYQQHLEIHQYEEMERNYQSGIAEVVTSTILVNIYSIDISKVH